MSGTALKLIETYVRTAEHIEQAISGLTKEQLVWKPTAWQWSVQEIVAHLVDSSTVHSVRIRKAVAEGEIPLLTYEQDAWVASAKAEAGDIGALLATLNALARHNADYYRLLTEQEWERTVCNGDQRQTVAELFEGFIRHTYIHAAQIERTKKLYDAKTAD